jgi:hypothetical protein
MKKQTPCVNASFIRTLCTISEGCFHWWFKSSVSLVTDVSSGCSAFISSNPTVRWSRNHHDRWEISGTANHPKAQRHIPEVCTLRKTAERTEHWTTGGNICHYLQRCRPLYAGQVMISTFIYCCMELIQIKSQLRYFRLPLQYKWGHRSSVDRSLFIDVSGQLIGPIFKC